VGDVRDQLRQLGGKSLLGLPARLVDAVLHTPAPRLVLRGP
jgi:hypothetical protein